MSSDLIPTGLLPSPTRTMPLSLARRVIVKIGSTLIVDAETGEIRSLWLETLIADIVRLLARGQEVLIVTSGAVAVGSRCCAHMNRPLLLEEKQAAASIGQVRIMVAYEQALKRHGRTVGQVLLTAEDIDVGHRHRNARATLEQLIKIGAIPVINENDTTATAEIRFGDNDQLAARVAQMLGADLLILLSNVDGLFTEDPHGSPAACFLPEIHGITPEIEAMAGHSRSALSSGGMVTKLIAAKIAMAAGCQMIIAKGSHPHPIAAIERGGPATRFVPASEALTS